MSHLLSLSELHAAAPGVLEVVFGPDGDFEGAPDWHPPLWDGAWAHHFGAVPDPIDGLALDLRVPSVAARLAGLCAQALDYDEPVYCWRNPDDGWIYLMPCDSGAALHWAEAESIPAFLAALTLAFAPRIRDLSRRES